MPEIVVAGDVIIDWLQMSIAPVQVRMGEPRNNWKLYPGTRMCARAGGALLLARWARAATGFDVRTHRLGALENVPPSEIIHSIVEVELVPFSRSVREPKVVRVKRACGYDGPAIGTPKPMAVADDSAAADVVVLDDACNGFRDAPEVWPAALRTAGSNPIVVYKMSRPLASGPLWDLVRDLHSHRMIVVVSADDLRSEGVKISRRLSWERTAKEFVWQLASNSTMYPLANCTNLIVRFGIDGAIHVRRTESGSESRLHFDPMAAEDGYRDEFPGDMIGYNSAFVAALTARVLKGGLETIGEGIRDGLLASRRLLREGFGSDLHRLDYPGESLFVSSKHDVPLAEVVIPNPVAPEPADPTFWCILQQVRGARLEDIAFDVVIHGDAASLREVPLGRFRNLRTVDRAEIESYRGIRNLILEYLAKSNVERPLSIAVFGPPGSGKSFGVTEVARSVDPERVEKIEFNISQFNSSSELTTALHRVRDITLAGKVPLVFFDEFDCAFQGRLGWLKYFLAPMQDGVFRDGETIHPIGRAIFVFAGGTCGTYDEFSRERVHIPGKEIALQEFRDAKGTDFISRLRGYVNVLGPNPTSDSDPFFLIRRAMLLRSLLERKARHLIHGAGQIQIDPGVLRALIKVPNYKHGVRSMEAIIDMSMLGGRQGFEQASLPAPSQLQMHVDSEIFSRLVVRDVLYGSARELLGMAVHATYLEEQKNNKPADDPSMQPWEKLREDLKESSRKQADHIPEKLRRIGCGFIPVTGREPLQATLTTNEIETLAEMEHDRWVTERRCEGWVLGPVRDVNRKVSPYLVPWGELDAKVKEWDRNAVRRIPDLLSKAGFELYRLT